MIKVILITITSFLFVSCSFSRPTNDWQFKSSNYFKEYTYNFLNDDLILAKNDFNRALKHAKKSADLTTLARIYLGECALNVSVGIEDKCEKYQNISNLLQSKELDAYYSFINSSIKKEQIELLPKQYRTYAYAIEEGNYKTAKEELFEMDKATSTLLSAALMKKNLDELSRENLIKLSSHYGYKKSVLFWLEESKKHLSDSHKIEKIDKKIAVLKYR